MTTLSPIKTTPNLAHEHAVQSTHQVTHIAGLDEAGRGALAGPVAAAAVILPLNDSDALTALSAINDSKQLTAKQRAAFYDIIVNNVIAYGIGVGSAERIDQEGIIAATKYAMRQAIQQLHHPAHFLLIDGRIRLNSLPIPQQSIIRGDSKSLTIAAASILAKVTRDRYLVALDAVFPAYHFAQHKGYGTAKHIAAIEKHGATRIHRHSFAPIRRELV